MLTYLDTLDSHYEEYHNVEQVLQMDDVEVEKNEADDVESEQNSEVPAETVKNV